MNGCLPRTSFSHQLGERLALRRYSVKRLAPHGYFTLYFV